MELQKLDAVFCRFLRVLWMGRAYDGWARRGWTKKKEVLSEWRIAHVTIRIAVAVWGVI